jgi:hypothetical protein
LVSDIPAGDRKTDNLLYSVGHDLFVVWLTSAAAQADIESEGGSDGKSVRVITFPYPPPPFSFFEAGVMNRIDFLMRD